MRRRPPRSTRTDTRFPYTTLFRSQTMIEAQAASWRVKQDEPGWSADEQQALDGWLAESADHLAAYWRLEHGWSRVGAAAAPAQDLDWWDDEAPAPKRRWLPMALAASLVEIGRAHV